VRARTDGDDLAIGGEAASFEISSTLISTVYERKRLCVELKYVSARRARRKMTSGTSINNLDATHAFVLRALSDRVHRTTWSDSYLVVARTLRKLPDFHRAVARRRRHRVSSDEANVEHDVFVPRKCHSRHETFRLLVSTEPNDVV
jgi:hypothetical protein